MAVRRWWAGSGAILTVALIVGVAWSQDASTDRNAGRPALSTTTTTDEWCMPISRAAAVARVMRLKDEVPPTAKARAKLFGTDYWSVEVEGRITPGFARGGPFGWAVYNIDAHTGDLKGMEAGPPGSTPSDWTALPDRTSSC